MNNCIKQDNKQCAVCGQISVSTCGQCSQVFYCGKEHQKSHWPEHKTECRPYKIMESDLTGRYLVASKFLPAGTLILKESPFVIGPKATSPLVCLTCHIPIIIKNFHRCPHCQWPMCSPECSGNPKHSRECEVLRQDVKQCGVPQQPGETPRYDLILVLRCLLLRWSCPVLWEKIQHMESHCQKRIEDAEPHHIAAVRYLTEVCKVGCDVQTVHHVRGAVITNAVNTKTSTGTMLRGLYSTISLLNHSCYPNITLRSDKNHVLYVRNTIDVQKDEPLNFSYIPTSCPYWSRQDDLKNIYYFSCTCKRCEDPSELSTYFSSPSCFECSTGFLIYQKNDVHWKCNKCTNLQSFKEIVKESKEYFEHITNKKLTQKYLKLFLKGVEEKYHKKHFLYFEALHIALAFLKESSSLEACHLRKKLWIEMIQILGIIEPGLTRRRGISLMEMAVVMFKIFEKEKSKSKSDIQTLLQELATTTEEAFSILQLEPPNSTEEYWKDLASVKLKEVRKLQSDYS